MCFLPPAIYLVSLGKGDLDPAVGLGLHRCSDIQSPFLFSKCVCCHSSAPSSVLGLTDTEIAGVETCEQSREGRHLGATRGKSILAAQGMFFKASCVMRKKKKEELGG